MTDPIRLGVVGAGSIALRCHFVHLPMPDVADKVKITAVCDPVLERAQAAAAKFDVLHAYETFEEMLDAKVVDAVSICSPIGVHFEQGMLAVQHGVHVHFNKTMTTTVDEADELIAAAEAANVKLVASPGQMLRRRYQAMKQQLEVGAIGEMVWAITGAAFGQYHEQEKGVRDGDDVLSNINPAWYFRKPGGGPMYDMLVYSMHSLTGILGPAKRVTAMSGVRIKEREFRGEMLPTDMDDNTIMVIDFGNSKFACAYGVAAGSVKGPLPAIFGTQGLLNEATVNGEPLEYEGRDLEKEVGFYATLPHVTEPHWRLGEEHVFEDVMQFVDLLRDGTPTVATPEHARHVIEIFDAAYRSADSGATQQLRTTF